MSELQAAFGSSFRVVSSSGHTRLRASQCTQESSAAEPYMKWQTRLLARDHVKPANHAGTQPSYPTHTSRMTNTASVGRSRDVRQNDLYAPIVDALDSTADMGFLASPRVHVGRTQLSSVCPDQTKITNLTFHHRKSG